MSTTEPLVDVVVPVYNKAESVLATLESVQAQTLSNFRCYVVDDGSTDGSIEVVRAHVAGDWRFTLIEQENSGVAHARNRGAAEGDAPFLCFLDADDRIAPQFLEVCVQELLKDVSLGVAYTGLWYIKPDGAEGLSPWPDEYDFDAQLRGQNQLPTCNVMRRTMFERLGGYNPRYCPSGAGEEDAELWLRAGAFGWGAKKATDAGMFLYSWLSGQVSGSREHKAMNWRAMHPFTRDALHPFASMAKPQRLSHAVRQYDQPMVSIIIPAAETHVTGLRDVLDSLEAQSFRLWEAIVVDDTGKDLVRQTISTAYPYVRIVSTQGKRGAGFARNRGAEAARAPFLLFLDADDELLSSNLDGPFDALEHLLRAWEMSPSIVYTDYAGKAYVDEATLNEKPERVLHYNPQTGLAVLAHSAGEYECPRAQAQPDARDMYIWCLITALVPREYHFEIGGFDEQMSSWEDWDYWIRMAKAGKCFTHLSQRLVLYRFYTGERRERGQSEWKNLVKYMQKKYEGVENMPCSSCGGRQRAALQQKQSSPPTITRNTMADNDPRKTLRDEDMVMVVYTHPNRGQHKVIGAATKTNYGYRAGGDKFLVARDDIALQPMLYQEVRSAVAEMPFSGLSHEVQPPPKPIVAREPVATPKPVAPPPPEIIREAAIKAAQRRYDLHQIPGVTVEVAAQLNLLGAYSLEDVAAIPVKDLIRIRGVGQRRAEAILAFCEEAVAAKQERTEEQQKHEA